MVALDEAIDTLMRGEILSEDLAVIVCNRAKAAFTRESNVKSIDPPVSVVGDIHGQFYDLLEMFKVAGELPHTNYLFLGDYVDRGSHSVETISLLLCLKLRYPDRITLLRGNHESRQITQVYGFYTECIRKYSSPRVWAAITDAFDYLPIAAVIGDRIFAVHGGLSPSINILDQLRILNRFGEIPHDGPIADIMWSDPDSEREGFSVSPRGAGYVFGHDVVLKFLWLNKLEHICRAHQLCMTGYQLLFKDECMSTVWSAPNYCYRFNNVASVLEIDERGDRNYNVFTQAPAEDRPTQAAIDDDSFGSSDSQTPDLYFI